MEVTRSVILDLLPLYVADEASADTRALVEKHLESDPDLARAAREMKGEVDSRDVPVPLNKESGMRAFVELKRLQFLRTMLFTVAGAVLLVMLAALSILVWMIASGRV
jgi:anti-sigma factor RsiW